MNKLIFQSALSSIVVLVMVTTLTTNTVIALGTPANPPDGSTFDQRLAQRKLEQNEQLDAQTQQHIQQLCKKEQTSIVNVQSKTTDLISKRSSAFQHIDGVLLVSIGQLKLATKDTFTLEKNRASMVQKMTNFLTTAAYYKQTLGDIQVVNCQADAVGFQALLDTARAYQTQMRTQSQDISNFITDTIQPALRIFGNQLQSKSNAGNQ